MHSSEWMTHANCFSSPCCCTQSGQRPVAALLHHKAHRDAVGKVIPESSPSLLAVTISSALFSLAQSRRPKAFSTQLTYLCSHRKSARAGRKLGRSHCSLACVSTIFLQSTHFSFLAASPPSGKTATTFMFKCVLQQILGVGTRAEKSLVRRVHVHAAACRDVLGFSASANSHAAVHNETHQDETARCVK